MISKTTIVFAGSGDFAVPILKSLVSKFSVALVITQPARPAGKGNKLSNTPVFEAARSLNLKVETPLNLESINTYIEDLQPKVMVVTDYGALIKESTLCIPELGVVNIHPSLLPKYRGPSPIQAALLSGDKETGTTFMLIDEKMDHGPILAQYQHVISDDINSQQLESELSNLSASNFPQILSRYISGEIEPVEQTHEKATFCKLMKKSDGEITDKDTVESLQRKIKALQPWPGVWLRQTIKGKELRISITEIGTEISNANAADRHPLLLRKDNNLFIQLTDGLINVIKIKPEGKKEMTGTSFIQGYLT